MKKEELAKQGLDYDKKYWEVLEESFVHVVEKEKIPLSRQIEEGIYNIKAGDYVPGDIGLRSSYKDLDLVLQDLVLANVKADLVVQDDDGGMSGPSFNKVAISQ